MGEWHGATSQERGTGSDAAWSPAAGSTGTRVDLDLPGYGDFVLIARGGESVVYRARQLALDRLVAIKVLPLGSEPAHGPDQAMPPTEHADSRRWFQRELEITMRLGQAHPNIVTVLDTSMTGAGEPCIVMEYYELGSLHDQLRARGRLPSSAVVAAGTVVADALAYAHGRGVLHRDVKPQNILVLPTSYVLADFGLARQIGTERSSSLERFSYRHAAPQVLDGELPTAADDVYSLASTLFTLLDGRPPFASDAAESDSALAYLRRARSEAPRPIRGTDAPAELLSVINRGLSRQREDRFSDAASLRDALADIATEARMWAPDAVHGNRTPRPTVAPTPPPAPSPAPPSLPEAEPVAAAITPAAEIPMARSAIEHLDEASLARRDIVRPLWAPDPTDPYGIEPTGRHPEPDASPPARRKGPRFAVRAGIALLVGGVLGLAGTWFAGTGETDGSPAATGRPVPSYTGSLPIQTGSPSVNDPSIAPQITTINDRGNAIELRWVDRSGGRATFVIVEVKGGVGTPVRLVDAGETSVVIDGIDPAAARYCYQILALMDTARGVSTPTCTPTRTAARS